MKDLNSIQVISFCADEFISSCPHLREDLSADQLSEIKIEFIYFMIKGIKSEMLCLGIKPPNKITVTNADIFEYVEKLVGFEKSNGFAGFNSRAQKDFRKAINGTYKTWIK